jgi:glycosyltransferase involved in cell wall biosynthesis
VKLAIVTETFPPEINGVAMTFGVIASELGRRGHSVSVYRPWRRDLPDLDATPDYRQIPVPGLPIPGYPLLRMGLPAAGRLRRAWAVNRPDLVHVATEGPLGLSAIRAARSLGIAVTSSFHTNFHAYARHYRISILKNAALGWLRFVHNQTNRTFAPTPDLCGELTRKGFRNLSVMSRGVDTRQFRPERRSNALRSDWKAVPDGPVVIHVGRMAAEKNYPLLFRVYAAMKEANPSCRFVLAGEGPLKRTLMKAHPDCVFAGFFSRDEIGRYYASADVYVHASLTETFGNVLTEAMASGLAVAGFDYAAARIFVRDGASGLLAPCDRPEALIAAGVRLATDPALRNRLRLSGRAAVEEQSWEKVIARLEAELAEVAGVAHAPASPAPALA